MNCLADMPPAAVLPGSVLVAIPALNEAQAIEACLRSLMQPERWMREVRIVVADGGSRDATRRIVRRLSREFPNIALIDNPGRLQSAALNRIAAGARPDETILVRCDAHAVYPRGYVRAVAESLARHGAAALVTPMDATGTGRFGRAAALIVDTMLGSGGAAHRGGRRSGRVDHGHHAGLRLDWFRRVGGYDPGFSHNEDAEFDLRLARAGGTIWLDARIRLAYRMRATPGGLARQYWNYGRGRARTLRKHAAGPRLRQALPAANLAGLAACLGAAPFWPAALAGPAAYAALLAGASLWAAARDRTAGALWAGPAAGIMHLCWGAGFLSALLGRRGQA